MTPTATPSPLIEVERAVQARAANLASSSDDDNARSQLRRLLEEEVARWTADFRHGLRPFDIADPPAVLDRAWRNLTGFGPLDPLLDDDDVWEIMINGPHEIFVKRHTGVSGYHHEVFHDDEHVLRTLTRILERSGSAHRKLDPAVGLQDAQLDSGARLHIVHGDLARGGHVIANIRKFSAAPIRSLRELSDRGSLDDHAAAILRAAVRAGLSTLVSGAPGAGKTTMLGCCVAELDPSLRVVIAEEVFEVDVHLPNVAHLQTRPARPDRPAVDLRRLVAGFLRMAPDVAIVGEVRDREALPLLLTLSSGVQGFATIHAGSARQALSRLRFLCQLSDAGRDLPMAALNQLVSESIDLVVHCGRVGGRPVLQEVIAVEDHQAGTDAVAFTATPLLTRPDPEAPLVWTGQVPARMATTLRAAGVDLASLLKDGR